MNKNINRVDSNTSIQNICYTKERRARDRECFKKIKSIQLSKRSVLHSKARENRSTLCELSSEVSKVSSKSMRSTTKRDQFKISSKQNSFDNTSNKNSRLDEIFSWLVSFFEDTLLFFFFKTSITLHFDEIIFSFSFFNWRNCCLSRYNLVFVSRIVSRTRILSLWMRRIFAKEIARSQDRSKFTQIEHFFEVSSRVQILFNEKQRLQERIMRSEKSKTNKRFSLRWVELRANLWIDMIRELSRRKLKKREIVLRV